MDFKKERLVYTNDGRLLDGHGKSIMMDWEFPIMKKSAEVICRNGGRVLNVGFGMGLIDSEIQGYNIDEHWIIELHPDVHDYMIKEGWHDKPNVKILYGDWRDFIEHLPKFDGIFIDTWGEELYEFHRKIPNILKEDGVYSFFNNTSLNKTDLKIRESDWGYLKDICNYSIEEIYINKIPSDIQQSNTNQYYWGENYNKYYCPILTLKK